MPEKPTLAYVAAVCAIVIWGATPAATEIAIVEVDAATVGILRTVLAAVCILPVAIIFKHRAPSDGAAWLGLAISSLGGFVGFTLLFSIGLQRTSTAHAALIIAGAPILTGLFGFILDGNWPRRIWWLGGAIAFAGEALLITVRTPGEAGDESGVAGDLLIVAATLCASAGYVAGGRIAKHMGTWAATSWSLGLAAVVLLPLLYWRLPATDWTAISWQGWSTIVYLALMSSIVGYAAWYWSIGRAGVARIAPIQFAQPVVSLALAVLVFAERITLPIVIATTAILIGIATARTQASTSEKR